MGPTGVGKSNVRQNCDSKELTITPIFSSYEAYFRKKFQMIFRLDIVSDPKQAKFNQFSGTTTTSRSSW